MSDAGRKPDAWRKPYGLRDKSVAFPMTDRRAEEFWIRIFRKFSSIGIDMTDLCVGFDDDGDFAGCQEEFHRIGLRHDSWHPRRETVRGRVVFRSAGLIRTALRLIFRV